MLAYAAFDAAGLPVGSGSVESANKVVIEARLKGAGMHWTRDHAEAMVALRAVVASGRWATVWPRIVTAMRDVRRQRVRQRRQARAAPGPDHPVSPVVPPVPASVPPVSVTQTAPPKTIVDGKPTANHPWKQFPACLPTMPAARSTES